MKLATFNDGSRDGQLMVVSRDLAQTHFASGIATRLQQVLDDWNFLSPQLESLYQSLNSGRAPRAFAFDARQCMAPLPRAYQWADGSAYLNHAVLLRRARGQEPTEKMRSDPLMYQGGSDDLLGAHDDVRLPRVSWGLDFEAELAVITGDVRQGARADEALDGVRLVALLNDWTLRERVAAELAKGFGFLQSKPATAFAPLVLTPDEFGAAWQGGRLHAWLEVQLNGERLARCDTGPEMVFHFGQLIAHLAKTRRVRAGSIIGSGTVSNEDRSRGVCCLAERRAIETLDEGEPGTPWLQHGDRVHIDCVDADGRSWFGAIDQRVVPAREAVRTSDIAANDADVQGAAAG
ncbi:MAG: fumarylacetoacetate hydrolase family protein [Burkholderiaceae bacterium]